MGTADVPENSRLFILCHPSLTAMEVKNAFDRFGTIEDCWIVYDQAKKSKGLCYVKYTKSSDAIRAMEEMDNAMLGNESRPIKVKMAVPQNAPNKRESESECFERLRCVFIRVPSVSGDTTPYTEESIKHEFSRFGNVVGCHVTRSGRNCYVTFEKPSQAAVAIEECNRDFAAVFVDPQKSSLLRKRPRERSPVRDYYNRSPSPEHYRRPPLVPTPLSAHSSSSFGSSSAGASRNFQYGRHSGGILPAPGSGNGSGGYYDTVGRQSLANGMAPMEDLMSSASSLANNPNRCLEIYMKINYPLSRESAFRVCNLVPGLETLELVRTTGENAQLHTIFLVSYSSPASASWAWEKLQDLEYPPGSYVRVRYADAGFPRDWDISAALSTPAATPAPVPAPLYSSDHSALAAAQMEALQNRLAEQSASDRESTILSTLVNTLSAAAASSSACASTSQSGKTYPFGRSECSVKLSYPKAMLPKSTPYEARLFFLCSKPIANEILEDAFSTFGDLINVYTISGKNCGYIMFACKRAAEEAVATMNGAALAGSRLKIMAADPEPLYKRPAATEKA